MSSLIIPPSHIETTRLLLDFVTSTDAPEMFTQYTQDQEVTRFLTWRPHKKLDETLSFVDYCIRARDKNQSYCWVIREKSSGQLIGMFDLRPDQHRASFGYVLARSYWNNGYMTETTKHICKWALAQSHVYRIWAVCDEENTASKRVLEKSGMQCEGLLYRWMVHPNIGTTPRNCWCFSLTR